MFHSADPRHSSPQCRIRHRGRETVEKIIAGVAIDENIELLEDLCNTMRLGSLCALGGFTPYPVRSALKHFPEDFRARAVAAAD